jgi:hypothetical protein
MTGTLQEIGTSTTSGNHIAVGSRDDRRGLGYAVLEPSFQLPRGMNSFYPYDDPDSLADEDIEIDEDSVQSVTKKSLDYYATDSLSANSADPFYFVGGNTKLSDCFWRVSDVLREIASFSDSMSPIPQLNSKRGPSMSGYGSSSVAPGSGGSSYKRTGTLQGWSKAPPPLAIELEIEEDEFSEEDDIYSLSDMVKKDSSMEDLLSL